MLLSSAKDRRGCCGVARALWGWMGDWWHRWDSWQQCCEFLAIPGQNRTSRPRCLVFSTPRWLEWTFSSIVGRRAVGTRIFSPLKMMPSMMVSSSRKFQYSEMLGWQSWRSSGQPCWITAIRACSCGSSEVACHSCCIFWSLTGRFLMMAWTWMLRSSASCPVVQTGDTSRTACQP